MKHLSATIITLATSLALSGCAFLHQKMPGFIMSDANLIGVLNTIDRNEIDAAELARDRSSSSRVQELADRILREHRELIDNNRRLAQQIAIQPQPSSLAAKLTRTHVNAMDTLRNTSGSDFDRTYLQQEISNHLQSLELVEAAEKYEGTQPLKQLLAQIRLDLIGHLFAAQALQRQLNPQPSLSMSE